MEKICPNCQRPNASEASFCRHCATPLPAAPFGAGGGGGGGGRPFAEPQQQNWQQNQQWNQPPNMGGGPMQGNFAPPAGGGGGGASGRAIGALVASILGFIMCCLPAGLVGAVLGWMEVNAIKEGRSSPAGMTMAQIGLWGGIVATALSIIFGIIYMLMIMAGGRF